MQINCFDEPPARVSQAGWDRGASLLAIDVVIPSAAARGWQLLLVERLQADGHDVAVRHRHERHRWSAAMRTALGIERRLFRRGADGLASARRPLPQTPAGRPAALCIDLCGDEAAATVPVLKVCFDGRPSDASAVAALARRRLPEIEARLDGRPVARARPMVDKPESVALAAEDVFARTVTLLRAVVQRIDRNDLAAAPEDPADAASASAPGFAAPYVGSALPRLGREAIRRMRYRLAHWRVGYRFHDGPGVAETGTLGNGWSVLPDDGTHFYADPFPFEWEGRHHVFVEDYPHATGKAVISVVSFDAEGRPSAAVPVLEEDHHLSYPQVFARDGAIWMLPEGSASQRLTLYRATAFPHGWTADSVLIDDREISDATIFEHGGRLWLFASERDGHGSTSDTMVVYHADTLKGPWRPHRMNPVAIDRRAARPGGAVAMVGRTPVLPLQDGTLGYGGGLGLAAILELNEETVRLGRPKPVSADGDFPYPMVHTLNRAGRLEVVDGIAAVRKANRLPQGATSRRS